jgi:hypothetical protein
VGVLVVFGLYQMQGDKRTARAARAIRVGDDSSSVLAALGSPAMRCAAGGLGHLRDALPPGTPRLTAEETLDRLRRGTHARWVWGDEAACTPRSGATEIGLSQEGRVLWAVAEHGGGPATLP